jgi:hypothetical protein
MRSWPTIKVLLSRSTLIEHRGILLRDVRLIEIPLGWRLRFVRFAACFYKARLPDELQFDLLHVESRSTPSRVMADDNEVGLVEDASRLIHLSGNEYQALCEMNGRVLHSWIVTQFGLGSRQLASRKPHLRRAA